MKNTIDFFWNRKTSIKWLLFFTALILLTMLGTRELWTQEWRWADISWNMMFSGDYFHPYLGDVPYYDKPLLSYWVMIVFSHLLGGLSTWSLRLPAALAGILAVFCTYRVGTLIVDRRVGLIAGWMLITTFYFLFWSRTANTDMLNVAGIMLATMWYFERREKPGLLTYSIYFLILAVSALFKGLIAPVISILVVLPDFLHAKNWKKHLRWELLPALIPAVIVYAIPFLLSNHFGSAQYGESGFYEVWRENVVRYFHPFDHQDPIYCYFIYLPLYLLPWTLLFIPAVVAVYKRWKTMSFGSRWTVWSTVLIFLFLTLSGSRRNYYVLPMVPFATLLTADWIAAGFATQARRCYIAALLAITSISLLFIYYAIAEPLYYSDGGFPRFAQQVEKAATEIRPWSQWNIVTLDAESKIAFYINPTKPITLLGLPSATRAEQKRRRETYGAQELTQLWPIILEQRPDTIIISRKAYLKKLIPYFRDYKIIIAQPTLGMRLLKQDDSAEPIAFIPTRSQQIIHFKIVPLGTSGGESEDNLSAYVVAPEQSNAWVALDAGTLISSLKKISDQLFQRLNVQVKSEKTFAETFFGDYLKAYLISHAHLDHISGLIIGSTIDSSKNILGTDTTINYLRDNVFNWKVWPNFADEGEQPQLKKYHYQRLAVGATVPVAQTILNVTPFALSHGNGYPSTAFLLEANGYYLLYFGDTGADAVEHSHDINLIWQKIAPLVRSHKLSAIFIEVSYPDGRPDNLLFGHLTPHWLLTELRELAMLVNPQYPHAALSGLPIVITHIKQGLGSEDMSTLIAQQLNQQNDLAARFVIPKQDQLMQF